MPREGLNPRQEEFVRRYCACGVGAEAYRQAGFKGDPLKGAQRLLAHPAVKAAIDAARLAQGVMSAEEVLRGLSDEARGSEKASDRLTALGLLGKHHKLFTDKHEVSGKDGEALTVKIVTYAETEGPAK